MLEEGGCSGLGDWRYFEFNHSLDVLFVNVRTSNFQSRLCDRGIKTFYK